MKKASHLLVGILLILLVWQLCHYILDVKVIPNPVTVLINTTKLLLTKSFILHIVASLLRLLTAIFIALILGAFTGVVVSMNKVLDQIISPVLYILFPVPKAALLPVIFVLFGLGDMSKIVVITLILYFQIAMTTYDSVKQIPESLFLSAKSIDLKGFDLYRHMIVPAIMPNLFTALRISVGIGVAVLFFVETYATNYGLGYYIMNHWSLLDYTNMYSGIVVLSLVGYGTFRSIDLIEKKMIQWNN